MKRFFKSLLLLPIIIGIFFLCIGIESFDGEVEPIQIESEVTLSGVLIKPETPGPHPAVLLLHGSGGRHQSYDKLYFKHHANAFLKKGFAVLVYSKRSYDEVDYRYFTYQDLLSDAQAAIDFLKNKKDIQGGNIGVMGLSESGWFTPELVSKNPEIKFLINRVSSPLSVRETMKHEATSDALADGFSIAEVRETILPIKEQIWDYYIGISNAKIAIEGPERIAINKKLTELHHSDRFKDWFGVDSLSEYDSALCEAIASRYTYDPSTFVDQVDIPMLYVLAGKDKNIPTQQVIEELGRLQEQGKEIDIKLYPDASHYLYQFGLEDGPYEGWMYYDDYLETITDWAVAAFP